MNINANETLQYLSNAGIINIEQVQTQEEHHVTDTASTKPSSEEDTKIDATPKDNETTDINQ